MTWYWLLKTAVRHGIYALGATNIEPRERKKNEFPGKYFSKWVHIVLVSQDALNRFEKESSSKEICTHSTIEFSLFSLSSSSLFYKYLLKFHTLFWGKLEYWIKWLGRGEVNEANTNCIAYEFFGKPSLVPLSL